MTENVEEIIRTEPVKKCAACGSEGRILFQDLEDLFFKTPGKWSSRKCVNKNCGLVWLDPMPIKKDISKAYENYFTHAGGENPGNESKGIYDYVKKGFLATRYGYELHSTSPVQKLAGRLMQLHPGWKAASDLSVMLLSASSGKRLLEVGCGAGQQLKTMKDLGWQVEGADRDLSAVEHARSKGLEVRHGSLEEIKYPEGSFNAIISNHVIEHNHDPLSFLTEMYRILEPGGTVVIATPNIESLGSRVFKHADIMFMDSPRHLFVFTPGSLKIIAERAGFYQPQVTTSVRHAAPLYFANKAIDRTGYYILRNPSRMDRLGAFGMQLFEWLAMKARPGLGEEVIFVGRK